jgi:hypothetical protein
MTSASCRVIRVLSVTLSATTHDRQSVCDYGPRNVAAVAGLMVIVTEFSFSLGARGYFARGSVANHGSPCRTNSDIRTKLMVRPGAYESR